MTTPNAMPRVSASERKYRALRAEWRREYELDVLAEERGRITESSAYVRARRAVMATA